MERLAENSQVNASRLDGGGLQVAQAILQVGKTMFASQLSADLNHLLGYIHGDHLARTQCEQLGESSFARSEVCNVDFLDECEQQV